MREIHLNDVVHAYDESKMIGGNTYEYDDSSYDYDTTTPPYNLSKIVLSKTRSYCYAKNADIKLNQEEWTTADIKSITIIIQKFLRFKSAMLNSSMEYRINLLYDMMLKLSRTEDMFKDLDEPEIEFYISRIFDLWAFSEQVYQRRGYSTDYHVVDDVSYGAPYKFSIPTQRGFKLLLMAVKEIVCKKTVTTDKFITQLTNKAKKLYLKKIIHPTWREGSQDKFFDEFRQLLIDTLNPQEDGQLS